MWGRKGREAFLWHLIERIGRVWKNGGEMEGRSLEATFWRSKGFENPWEGGAGTMKMKKAW